MKIKIIVVGKIKERFYQDEIKEFLKRLRSYCTIEIIEIKDENINNETLAQKYKELEAQRILPYIKPESYTITLEIKGKQFSSMEFANQIKEIEMSGINEINFVIGGANGLHPIISKLSNLKLSFSKMTFTHQMIRGILLEQIYRAFKILKNEPYHR